MTTNFQIENRVSPYFEYYPCPEGYYLTRTEDIFQLVFKPEEETYIFRFRRDQRDSAIKAVQGKKESPLDDWQVKYNLGIIINEFIPG